MQWFDYCNLYYVQFLWGYGKNYGRQIIVYAYTTILQGETPVQSVLQDPQWKELRLPYLQKWWQHFPIQITGPCQSAYKIFTYVNDSLAHKEHNNTPTIGMDKIRALTYTDNTIILANSPTPSTKISIDS